MDNGTIDFYRNGKHLGRAFKDIGMGYGFAYFPTVSLAVTENLTANFGSTPMHYPIEGYEPLQAAPQKEITQATFLFEWFLQIIKLIDTKKNEDEQNTSCDGNMSIQAFLMCLSSLILKHMGSLLTIPYITEYIFIPFVEQLTESKTDSAKEYTQSTVHSSMLLTCLDLLWTFLEEHEIKACLESTVLCLLSAFRHVSFLLEYPNQCKTLLLLTRICQHTSTRQYLLQYLLFDRVRFANFMHVKPLDEGGLADIVDKVWWETNPVDATVEINKASYLETCENIKAAISGMISFQYNC